jgi:hypothetical protein
MKYIKEFEQYKSDEDIESEYDDIKIVGFTVTNIRDDGGASGWIDIEFPYDEENDYAETRSDNWIKYDSGPTIAFDYWYPEKTNKILKEYIEEGIKKEKIRRDSEKYNL